MRELDWIVRLLIDLHSFCEQNGFKSLSDRLADAIEEAAPMIRGKWPEVDAGQERANLGQITRAAVAETRPPRPVAPARPRLVAVNLDEACQ